MVISDSMIRKGSLALIVAIAFVSLAALMLMASQPTAGVKSDMSVRNKVLCTEGNYCIEMKITCMNGHVAGISLVGEGQQYSGRWLDKRTEQERLELC